MVPPDSLPDPAARAGWYGFGIIALLLIAVPFACTVTRAQVPPDTTRADGPAQQPDVRCVNGWCLVKQDTLKSLLTGLQKLDEHARELRELCGWRDKP